MGRLGDFARLSANPLVTQIRISSLHISSRHIQQQLHAAFMHHVAKTLQAAGFTAVNLFPPNSRSMSFQSSMIWTSRMPPSRKRSSSCSS